MKIDVRNRVFSMNGAVRLLRTAAFAGLVAFASHDALAQDGVAPQDEAATNGGAEGAVETAAVPPQARPRSRAVPQDAQTGTDGAADGGAAEESPADGGPAPEPAETEQLVETDPPVGPETNLPLPRFVSLKASDSNVRRGPSLSHRIDWVFMRRDMPLQITAEYGHWRRVSDREGLGGWVHYSLLSGTRTVIVDADMLPLLARPEEGAPQQAILENGVIARLGECADAWCRLTVGGYRGWAPRTALWGVDQDDPRD